MRVESSVIYELGYQPRRSRLLVRFVSGELYAYEGVSRTTYHVFLGAESKGRFFQAHIRDRYPYEKLS